MTKHKPELTDEEEEELRKNPVCLFTCCGAEMDFKAMQVHLWDVHKIYKGEKMQKTMLMHLDSEQTFTSTYQWSHESGLKFTQYVYMARAKDDWMRHH